MAKAKTRKEPGGAPAPDPRRVRGEAALTQITEPMVAAREGWRHGWLGDSGMGKTTAAIRLLSHAVSAGGSRFTVSLDDSGRKPQVPGAVRPEIKEVLADLMAGTGGPHYVLHSKRRRLPVEPIAAACVLLARELEIDHVLYVDELARAATPAGKEWESPSTREAFAEGRKIGLSVCWTTQSPARVPPEAIDQTTSLGIFRLDSRALRYFDQLLTLPADMVAALPKLARGDFVLWRKGHPWDRAIYRFEVTA